MEKLIIKNFGPISEVEIEIKKYTLLIGDTSTGKSIIAKLICIFKKIMQEGIEKIEDFNSLLKNYNIDFLKDDSEIEYYLDNYFVKIKGENLIKLSDELLNIYRIKEIMQKISFDDIIKKIGKDIELLKNDIDKEKLDTIESQYEKAKQQIDELRKESSFIKRYSKIIYIPAERMFFSMLGKSISGLWANNVSVSKSYLDFAGYYEVAKKNSSKVNYSDLGFTYHNNDDKEYIEYKGQKLDIQYTSSGVQAILPLIVVLNYLAETKKDLEDSDQMICVEEPEISLFPQRQKELVEHIVSIVNRINSRLVITTHSPYVLSAFNNMMLASNTAIEKEERKEEIKNIISEDKWIRYEDVSAYEVKDGKVISLLDEEFKGLDVNAIDKVSDIITEQVDQLISIRYEE
ncbi:AAA family ATPase [Capnocytophaga canis]|uniref:AAA family ATPase n=1 Tax=Capnocytophaga canis TaxID=1848903 RepID=UPI00370DAC22